MMSVVVGFSQINNISPYSYFGIGDYSQQNTVSSSSMGGLSVATDSSNEVNFNNPAANASLKFTTFSIAGNTNFLKIDDGNTEQDASFTNLTYIALGFPIGKKAGMFIGLQPNSNVGYAITEELYDLDETIIEANIFNGNGGTNRFFGSFGYEVSEGIRLGVEAEYIFGKIDNNLINQRLDVALSTKYQLDSNISGSSIKFGVQYQKEIKEGLEIKAGITAKLKNTLDSDTDELMYSFSYSSYGQEIPQDTLISNFDVSGKITRPFSWSGGLGLGKPDVWYAGIEYAAQDALSFDDSVYHTNNKVVYEPSSKLSVGGFWLPKKNSLNSYWHRVTYRAGVKFESPGLSINTSGDSGEFTSIDDFGISFGLGLPIGNQLSQINLGLEYGNRGNTSNGLIKENYYNLRLGLNLADKWFQKRKIN